MNNKQETKYAMEQTTRDFLVRNKEITDKLPTFNALFPRFTSNLLQVGDICGLKAANKNGMAVKKEQLRTSLATKAFGVAIKTEAYAKINSNPVLAAEVHFTESELLRATDTKLIDKANLIYIKANANIGKLAEYGVTPEMLAELKDATTLLNAEIPSMRIERNESKAATHQLNRIFTENDEILEKIDILVEVVRTTYPDFYNQYKSIRKIPGKKTTTLSLTTHIVSAANGEPIKGAKATFIATAKSSVASATKESKPIVKKTAEKGIFKVKNLPEGTYTVIIEKSGYATITETVSISDNEMTTLDIKMDKN